MLARPRTCSVGNFAPRKTRRVTASGALATREGFSSASLAVLNNPIDELAGEAANTEYASSAMIHANAMEPRRSAVPPMPRWAVGAVWVVLTVSIILDVKVPLGDSGRLINLSAFDVAVPLCLVVMWASGRISRPNLPILSTLGVAVLLVLCHSGVSLWLDPAVEPVGLARETVKLVAACTLLAMLLTLFTAAALRAPPAWLLLLIILVISADALSQRFEELRHSTSYSETLDANTIVGLLVLSIAALAQRADQLRRAVAVVAALAVSFLMVLLFSKAYIVMSVAVSVLLAAWFILGGRPPKHVPIIGLLLAVGTVSGIGVVVLAVWFGSTGFTYFPIGSIGTSLSLRLALWDFAWRLAVENFPWGTGLGQYGALIIESPKLGPLGLRYVHNTALALLTEMGALGLLMTAGLGYLVYLSCRHWAWPVALTVLIYLLLPLMLHDALGMRMSILVLAYGVSESLRRNDPCSAQRAAAGDDTNQAPNVQEKLDQNINFVN